MGAIINLNDLKKSKSLRLHNKSIADYYSRMAVDDLYNKESFEKKSSAIKNCSHWWSGDYYPDVNLKLVQSVSFCHDRFCSECQSKIADYKLMKYGSVIDDISKDYSIWHVVFTVKNCKAENLKSTLDSMYSNFKFLVRYLDGRKKLSGFDFSLYGYSGCIRSLEVTYNFKQSEFHPHFHCIFLLKKGLVLDKYISNRFSWSKGENSRKFSEFEIILQKIWYLRMTGQKVCLENFDKVDLGYSCIVDPGEDHVHEVFKYAVKGIWDGDKLLSFKAFKYLYSALLNRRIIQCYGLFHGYNFEDVSDENSSLIWQELHNWLESLYGRSNYYFASTFEDVYKEVLKKVRFLSKNSLKSFIMREKNEFLNSLSLEDRKVQFFQIALDVVQGVYDDLESSEIKSSDRVRNENEKCQISLFTSQNSSSSD